MATTYEPIATQTLGSAAASIEFTSIPGTYTDLVLVMQVGDSTNDSRDIHIQVGNASYDTGTNYSRTYILGSGSAASSGRNSTTTFMAMTYAVYSNSPLSENIVQFMNYSNSTTNKTVLSRHGGAGDGLGSTAFLWRSTAAIQRIKVFCQPTSNLNTGSTFTLYGIKAA